jgi:acetyl-CoA acetyltransferase
VNLREVVIIDGARTPFGEFCGALQDIKAIDLGAIAARGAIERSNVKPEYVDQVIFGNVLHTSSDAIYGARHVALKSGVPIAVPALTLNRIGGSGLQAVISGAQMIRLNAGYSFMEDSLWTALIDSYNNMMMVDTAENIARKYNISRREQDEFAFRSYTLAVSARDRGRLSEEILPVNNEGDSDGGGVVWTDESIRETTIERLAAMKPAIRKDGVVTSGNSSGLNDGAAALIIASGDKARELGLKPKARLKSYGLCGVDPDIMGIGAVPALKIALDKVGMEISDIDLFEINESFACQYIVCERDLNLDRDKVNVNGGAIAIGNPLAASGARLVITLIYEMVHRGVAT